MTNSLDKLTIRGFKSIRELKDFELKNLNIFIGANGAGKSNLISFLQMLQSCFADNLERYVFDNGGADELLHKGRKTVKKMESEACFGSHVMRLDMIPGPDGDGFMTESSFDHLSEGAYKSSQKRGKDNDLQVAEESGAESIEKHRQYVREIVSGWKFYHFHDTSSTAAMRHSEIVEDDKYLRHDASNIAPYLLRLREEEPLAYKEILSSCRLVASFLDDFLLEPKQVGPKTKVSLTWKAKGSDYPMQAHQLSDGTIRFICLATALLQPNLPSMIIIDEPDLGLHPEAIHILSELIEGAARKIQVMVTTQSPLLLDEFAIEDIVVVKREDRQSGFERLKYEDFNVWLEEYSVGELWTKNVIQGDLAHEPLMSASI